MKKRKVRVYTAFAEAGGVYNNEVFFTAFEGYRVTLAICIQCGELFGIDWENPNTAGLTLKQIAGKNICQKCGVKLAESLRNYPETFVGKGGRLGSYMPSTYIPPEVESKIIEVWEVIPESDQAEQSGTDHD